MSRNVIGLWFDVCARREGTPIGIEVARRSAAVVTKVRAIIRGAYARETVRSRRAIERIIPA